jgi:hypothetical protein
MCLDLKTTAALFVSGLRACKLMMDFSEPDGTIRLKMAFIHTQLERAENRRSINGRELKSAAPHFSSKHLFSQRSASIPYYHHHHHVQKSIVEDLTT